MMIATKADMARNVMTVMSRHPGTKRSLITTRKLTSRYVANIVKRPATHATKVNYIRTNPHLRTN